MSLDEINILAEDIHFNSIVLDCHNDTMLKVVDEDTGEPRLDIGKETDLDIDLDKAFKGGLNVGYFAAFTPLRESEARANNNILGLINALYWNRDRNSDRMEIVSSVDEIREALEANKLAAMPTIEGAYSIDGENGGELLNQYYDLGIRLIAYVWNQENNLGAGTEGPDNMGLTELGKEITREMNRLGIIIDVSHMNEKTFWDTLEYSKAPIMASHSCASALTAHVRNLRDEQILAIKENGGLVNINYWWELLGKPKASVNVGSLVDHIDYVVNLIGVDHVGLGSDFDGASMPRDIGSVMDLPKITEELVKRGYSREDIEKILGLNNLRLLDKVQSLAVDKEKNDLEIEIKFARGASLGDLSLLEARAGQEDLDRVRLIVDGREYPVVLDGDIISLGEEVDLYKGYHVASFEVYQEGRKGRETRIFYYE